MELSRSYSWLRVFSTRRLNWSFQIHFHICNDRFGRQSITHALDWPKLSFNPAHMLRRFALGDFTRKPTVWRCVVARSISYQSTEPGSDSPYHSTSLRSVVWPFFFKHCDLRLVTDLRGDYFLSWGKRQLHRMASNILDESEKIKSYPNVITIIHLEPHTIPFFNPGQVHCRHSYVLYLFKSYKPSSTLDLQLT